MYRIQHQNPGLETQILSVERSLSDLSSRHPPETITVLFVTCALNMEAGFAAACRGQARTTYVNRRLQN